MKRIIYFLSFILTAMLYSCSDLYDNIDKYVTDETVYVGKFSEEPFVRIGYKRLEIELMGDSIGRAFSDDLYLGKAKRTIVEYDESDGRRKIEFDSVCSWVNIKGLTTAKTYIFSIYNEDEFGNKSTAIEAFGKPYTDADFSGIAFPMPRIISAPTTVEFAWENEVSEGLSSPLFKFVELIYSYVDADDNMFSGKIMATDAPSFNMKNLPVGDSTSVTINYRIIPISESGLILDTLSRIAVLASKTSTAEEYLAARSVRPIISALIDPWVESTVNITFGDPAPHAKWTEIRYLKTDGDSATILVDNGVKSVPCLDFQRRSMMHIRCLYNPPETTTELQGDWKECNGLVLKPDPYRWVSFAKSGNHNWDQDHPDPLGLWDGGHPMHAYDGYPTTGWHSHTAAPYPQVYVIDMQETTSISSVDITGDYFRVVELYLTDDLAMSGYQTHTIDWDASNRKAAYDSWRAPYESRLPSDVPPSWGKPVSSVSLDSKECSFVLPEGSKGRFMILRFPNGTSHEAYIDITNLEAYSD